MRRHRMAIILFFLLYEDNLKLRSYLQSKYKPGDVMSPEDFRANAALFGGKVEVFDILERIDTRTQRSAYLKRVLSLLQIKPPA